MRDREIVVRFPIDTSKWEALRKRGEGTRADFEDSMERVRALTALSSSEIEALRQRVLKLAEAEEPEWIP